MLVEGCRRESSGEERITSFKKFHCNSNYCCQIQFEEKDEDKHSVLIAGVPNWNIYNRKAFGISMSLYDQNPVSHKISGM